MKEKCNCCNVNFNEDNGYKYILDELKRIQKDVSNIIDLLETRVEKDNIIDDILSADYEELKKQDKQNDTIGTNNIKQDILESLLQEMLKPRYHPYKPYHINTTLPYWYI